jgi:predicted RNA-binding Zn-ribbon protein involved in translation (DUF1610 family)
MTEYNCPRCGYYTTYKSHFANHINRKKICKPTYSDLDISIIKDEYSITNQKLAKPVSIKLAKTVGIKLAKNQKNTKTTYECAYCGKEYMRANFLNKHEHMCKMNNTDEYESIIEENKALKNVVSNLNKKMDNLADKITNNINISNSQVNSNNTIIINNFGNENLSYIDKTLLQQIIMPPYPAIIRLNEIIHCNDEHPENKNIKISNINGKFLQVYENNTWVHKAKKEIIPAIVGKSYDILDDCYNGDEYMFQPIQEKRYTYFQNDYEKDNKLKEQLCKKTELMIFNKNR